MRYPDFFVYTTLNVVMATFWRHNFHGMFVHMTSSDITDHKWPKNVVKLTSSYYVVNSDTLGKSITENQILTIL